MWYQQFCGCGATSISDGIIVIVVVVRMTAGDARLSDTSRGSKKNVAKYVAKAKRGTQLSVLGRPSKNCNIFLLWPKQFAPSTSDVTPRDDHHQRSSSSKKILQSLILIRVRVNSFSYYFNPTPAFLVGKLAGKLKSQHLPMHLPLFIVTLFKRSQSRTPHHPLILMLILLLIVALF